MIPCMALSRPFPPHRKQISSITQRTPPSLTEGNAWNSLRDKSDDQITTDDLVQDLRGKWDLKDKMVEKIEMLETNRDKLERDIGELSRAMATLQSRFDESLNEQSRMETDLIERNELLDRLRKRVSETERQVKGAQKRYTDQETAFETERRAFQAQEDHLRARINALLSASRKSTNIPAIAVQRCEDDTISSLKDEIASLKLSCTTLRAKNSTLAQDMQELKNLNNALKEDKEAWELFLRERTLEGDIREMGGLLDADQLQDRYERHEPESLNEELLLESPSSKRGKKANDASYSPRNGLDLASELGILHEEGEPGYLQKDIDAEALKNEIKQLKDTNKALNLYCSKIIDRIIAQEGFEHILSVDYKTGRAGSRNVSAVQTPFKGIAASLAQDSSNAEMTSQASASSQNSASLKDKGGRPLSMMVARAFFGEAGKTSVVGEVPYPSPLTTSVEPPRVTAAKQEKKARRGFSLDFRSFGFGGITTPESPNPALRPLTLASRATSATSPSVQKEKGATTCRKLEPTEEDEEDRRERHRMEATLKLMGISKSVDASNGQDNMKTKSPDSRKSPWSRIYSTIGSTEHTFAVDNINPAAAQTALNEYDQREAERM